MSPLPQVTLEKDEDPSLAIPPEVLLTSFEPKYQFNWQNPELCKDIYPFRNEKLIDFLAFYAEVDLVKKYRGSGAGNPQILAQIQGSEASLREERRAIDNEIAPKIAARRSVDKYFDKIGTLYQNDPQRLRKNYLYYLDREEDRLQEKVDKLEDRQKELIKRKGWWPNSPERQKSLQDQADTMEPEIEAARQEVAPVQELLRLFERQNELPDAGSTQISMEDIMRWEIRNQRQAWDKLDSQALLKVVIERINLEPDRFPEWLVYMVFHFSGMRYVSAHGSWADPRDLLELLRKEDKEDEINTLAGEELKKACDAAIAELQARLKPGMAEDEKKSIEETVGRLNNEFQKKRALTEYRIGQIADEVKALSDDGCLDGLVAYRASKALAGDPIPNWMWAEIVKYTPLRLNTSDDDWEAYSPERWKAQNNRYTEVLNTWEKKDITGWRNKHAQSLELVVTRSVCNEIAEHIQHLRGHTPYAGLTSKPKWYLLMASDKVFGPYTYLIQAPEEQYFQVGASILWLQWMEQRPSAWQVATSLPGYTFIPGQDSGLKKGMKGETPRRELVDRDWDSADGWRHLAVGNTFQRERPKPTVQELKQMKKSPEEIKQITADYAKTGTKTIEYLRWRHEATVVDVVDMIDGRYVLTFETGKIGIIRRRLSDLRGNPLVFAGYAPEVEQLPPEMNNRLVNMLRWDRILPGAPLPERVRPKKLPWKRPGEVLAGIPVEEQAQPQRQAVVIREKINYQEIFDRDNQDRPKLRGVPDPIKLKRGDLINIYSTHKESQHDTGDGVIHTNDGEFVKISQCPSNPKAVGHFARRDEIEFMDMGKWMKFKAESGVVNFQALTGYDNSKFRKPIFEPTPMVNRISLTLGANVDGRVRVSTIHTECPLDKGDGVVNSTGLQYYYYLVLECPAQPKASGYFIKTDWAVDS